MPTTRRRAGALGAWCLLLMGIGPSVSAHASTQSEVDALIAAAHPPDGVVFEIVSGQADTLKWAIPAVRGYARRLHARFPGLSIAVVTHGKEQFALTKANRAAYAEVHSGIRSLTAQDGVELHVCGTFAGWRNVSPEDFPDYVQVAASGPAQINNYRDIGYVVIKVKRPAN